MQSIVCVGVGTFYDLTVPGPAHYYAEGFWNHNTGKTYACCNKLNALLWKYPNTPAVIGRKVQATVYPTVLSTFQRVAAPDGWDQSPLKRYGGETPQWIDYPNGSRLYVVGLDNPGKALSSERAFIYICQMEDLSEEDWEVLLTRATGRGVSTPYTQVFGDCNPSVPTHWILSRTTLRRFQTTHRDNPTLYDDAGNLTKQGERSLSILQSLTGSRRERLYFGRWVQAEGVIYEHFVRARHVVPNATVPAVPHAARAERRPYWGIDFGLVNPFVWGELSPDNDDRLFLTRELYHTGLLVADAVTKILTACQGDMRYQLPGKSPYGGERFGPEAILCDHDAEDRLTFQSTCYYCRTCARAMRESEADDHHRGLKHPLDEWELRTKAANKEVGPGIQDVTQRLGWETHRGPSGEIVPIRAPGLFFVQNALIHAPDPVLTAARKPTCTVEELEGYIWAPPLPGKAPKEAPLKKNDHGADMIRYVVRHLGGGGRPKGTFL